MIINWVKVLTPEQHGEDDSTICIVGSSIEERLNEYSPFPEGTSVEDRRYKHGVDPNEATPCWVKLKIYPKEKRYANKLSVEFLYGPDYYEHDYGVRSITALIKAVYEIKGLSQNDAQNLVFGRVIEPIQDESDYRLIHE